MAASGRVEKKQERVLLACDNCRRRKIRCDSVRPQCGNCDKLKDECVYTPSARQATANTRYAQVEQRIGKLEEIMETVASKIDLLMSIPSRSLINEGDHANLRHTLVASFNTSMRSRGMRHFFSPPMCSDGTMSGSTSSASTGRAPSTLTGSTNSSPIELLNSEDLNKGTRMSNMPAPRSTLRSLVEPGPIGGTEPMEPEPMESFNSHPADHAQIYSTAITVPFFNDRLAHLKNHTGGTEVSSTVYTSGVFLSLFSQADVEQLSARLNEPFLNERLEAVSGKVWKTNQDIVARILEPIESVEYDPEFMKSCMEGYKTIEKESQVMSIFMRAEELQPEIFGKYPDFIQQGFLAAVVLIGIADINMNDEGGSGGAHEMVEKQRQIALNRAIRTLNIIRFSKPSCTSCRLSFLLVFIMAAFSTIPSLLSFVPPAIEMAVALGLDRPEHNARCSPRVAQRRNDLWSIVEAFQYTLCIPQSSPSWVQRRPSKSDREKDVGVVDARLVSPVTEDGGSPKYPQWFDGQSFCPRLNDRNLYAILKGSDLELMYDRVRSTLFALHNRDISLEALYQEVCEFHQGLQEWSERAKPIFVEYTEELATYSSFLKWLDLFAKGSLCQKYFHLQIMVYSIHAFYPSYLPALPGKVNALDLVSNAARNLLACAVCAQRRKGACTLVLNSSVTAAIGTLLYKQLSFPDHESNADDLEMLKRHIPEFVDTIWPSDGLGNPMTEIWTFLVGLMDRLEKTRHIPPGQPPSCQPAREPDTISGYSSTNALLEEFDSYLPDELLTQPDGNCNVS